MLPRRTSPTNTGLLVIALALALAAPRGAFAQAAAHGTALNGVLVLRNGNVLEGAVRRSGDEYQIEVTGATLQVPADQVERFASSLGEVYEARRLACDATSADAHAELAAWCLQQEMFDQAARELLDVRTIDPHYGGLVGLEARLQQLVKLEAERLSPVVKPPVVSPTPGVVAQPEVETLPVISTEAQTQFIRSIQPMLIRNCSTGGCHQKDSAQRMQLDRWALEGSGNAETVRRNLAAVLRELNRDDPSASSVLRFGSAEHGSSASGKSRSLTPRQAELLLEWLNAAAGIEPSIDAPPVGVAAMEPIDGADGTELNGPDEQGEPAAFTPRDSFDPEIFNRRQARKRAAREAVAHEFVDAAEDDADVADADDESAETVDPSRPLPAEKP